MSLAREIRSPETRTARRRGLRFTVAATSTGINLWSLLRNSRIPMYKHSRFCPYRVPLASLQSLDRPRKRQRITGIGVFGLYSCRFFLGTQAWRGVACPAFVPYLCQSGRFPGPGRMGLLRN